MTKSIALSNKSLKIEAKSVTKYEHIKFCDSATSLMGVYPNEMYS